VLRRCSKRAGGSGRVVLSVAFDGGAHLHLAALEAGCEQAAQRGFERAQLVGQAEGQVQKAAVDRTDFQAQPAILGRAALGFSASGRRLAARWRIRSCCKLALDFLMVACDPAIIRVLPPPSHLRKICQKSNPPHCHPIPLLVATAWCAGSLPAASAWCTSLWIPKASRSPSRNTFLHHWPRARPASCCPRCRLKNSRCTAWASRASLKKAARWRRFRTPRWSACSTSSARTKPSTW
jgi:hypothetical protein